MCSAQKGLAGRSSTWQSTAGRLTPSSISRYQMMAQFACAIRSTRLSDSACTQNRVTAAQRHRVIFLCLGDGHSSSYLARALLCMLVGGSPLAFGVRENHQDWTPTHITNKSWQSADLCKMVLYGRGLNSQIDGETRRHKHRWFRSRRCHSRRARGAAFTKCKCHSRDTFIKHSLTIMRSVDDHRTNFDDLRVAGSTFRSIC